MYEAKGGGARVTQKLLGGGTRVTQKLLGGGTRVTQTRLPQLTAPFTSRKGLIVGGFYSEVALRNEKKRHSAY